MKNKYFTSQKLLPLILLVAVVLLDQITKTLVANNIPQYSIGASFFGDFLRIVHVRNPGIAFSIGHSDFAAKAFLFKLLPFVVLIFVMIFYFKENLTSLQRWALCGIVGGGFGNIIDRVFRETGVVDFIDVKFYGLFGFERWPTFNIADSAVVVCGILLVISFLIASKKTEKENSK